MLHSDRTASPIHITRDPMAAREAIAASMDTIGETVAPALAEIVEVLHAIGLSDDPWAAFDERRILADRLDQIGSAFDRLRDDLIAINVPFVTATSCAGRVH